MSEAKREGHIRRITNALMADEAKVGIHFTHDAVVELLELLKEKPERKPGKWIKISPAGIYECSECGQNVMTSDIDCYAFCHGCGADMRGEQDG